MTHAVLSIQSHVVFGHVGNSAAAFALQRLGLEVWPLNTVQYSSHAGYPGWRGQAFDAPAIDECVAGLAAIGALQGCDGVLSGYLGKPGIGEAVLRALHAVRAANAHAAYACDPVIGDVERGTYVAAGVAEFFRDRALPAADILTPNAFELEWLTGRALRNLADARAAFAALRARGPRVILVTSATLDDTPDDALDLLVCEGARLWRLRTPKIPIAVHGAGDLISALFFAHWLTTRSPALALGLAASSVFGIVAATAAAGSRELSLVAAQQELVAPSRRFEPEPV